MTPCAILHGEGMGSPHDEEGCRLPRGHEGPHEYVARDGTIYNWETDLDCACESCMADDPDFCTIYWEKERAQAAAQQNGESHAAK
jgi:hypothetical protein